MNGSRSAFNDVVAKQFMQVEPATNRTRVRYVVNLYYSQ
jgi:hypothetical protein